MLEINNVRSARLQTTEALSAAEFHAACVGFMRRQLSSITFALLLGLALGALYAFCTPPLYTARAVLIVDAPKTQFFQSESPLGGSSIDSATVDTQIQILNSEDLAISVIKHFQLNEDKEFISLREDVFDAITTYAKAAIAGALNAILPGGPRNFSQAPADDRALHTFQNRLKVKRVALTYAIEITFSSRFPFRAAQIANAIADAYEVEAFQAKYQITGRSAEWLKDRLNELREQAANAEHAVVDYKGKNNPS
jgi:polysaccharide biosynthesis transport protein